MGDGMVPPIIWLQSTKLIHDGRQLLGDPTGKSVDFWDISTTFTSDEGIIDSASFANNIAQGNDSNFADNSSSFATTNILPRALADPVDLAASFVSFLDDEADILLIMRLAGFQILIFALVATLKFRVIISFFVQAKFFVSVQVSLF